MTTNGTQQAANAYTEGPSNQVDVIDTQAGRILCVADVRGASIGQTIAQSSAYVLLVIYRQAVYLEFASNRTQRKGNYPYWRFWLLWSVGRSHADLTGY